MNDNSQSSFGESQSEKIILNLAPNKDRMGNTLIDTLLFYFLYLGLISLSFSELGIDAENDPLYDLALLLLSHIIIYAVTEILFQKTVGKFITRTYVVNLKGEKPSVKNILIRTFCRLIPCEAISFLFMENGIHDKFSKTRVVRH